MTGGLTAVIGLALVGTMVVVLLRQYRPEFGLLISIGTGILLFLTSMQILSPVLDVVERTLELVGLSSGYGSLLFKAVGICFLTQLAVDLCRDVGESAIAAKVELAGRASVLLLSLPMAAAVLEWAADLLSM